MVSVDVRVVYLSGFVCYVLQLTCSTSREYDSHGSLKSRLTENFMNQAQQTPALALGIDEAARVIGVARSMLYEIVGRGEIESFKLGRRRLILVKNLDAYINRVAAKGAR